MSEENTKEKPQDGLALIIGGLFILALIFAAYNYFKTGKNADENEEITDQGIETTIDSEKGDLNGEGAKDTKANSKTAVTDKTTTKDSTTVTKDMQKVEQTSTWVANNYNNGDIKGASYTVKSGDTLWEIAEGAYGDGSQWTKVLNANKDKVGFLPSGQQSLIMSGQVLVLP